MRLHVGQVWVITNGALYAFECLEPTVMVEIKWFPKRGVVDCLYHLGLWHQGAANNIPLCKGLFPNATKDTPSYLDVKWSALLIECANDPYQADVNAPFSFDTPSEGGVSWTFYKLTRDVEVSMEDEMEKGKFMFALGAVARMMGKGDNLKISTITKRSWGGLTSWVKAHLGTTTTQDESHKNKKKPYQLGRLESPKGRKRGRGGQINLGSRTARAI
jgi:hypothetical protein